MTPWSVDSTGKSLDTHYELEGNTLIQVVDTSGATFPVVSDPVPLIIMGIVAAIARIFAPVALRAFATVAIRAGAAMTSRGGFATFNAFTSWAGAAKPGYQWHHIVGQSQTRFPAAARHNPQSLVMIPTTIHQKMHQFLDVTESCTFSRRRNVQVDRHRACSSGVVDLDPAALLRGETAPTLRRQRMKGADDHDGAIAAEATLRNSHSEKLACLLVLENELRANRDRVPMEMSVPKWNARQDRWNRAADEVTHDSDLLEQLRRAVPATVNRRDRALLAQLLSVPLDVIPADREAILVDPWVGLTAGQVDIAPAVYLVDIDWHPEDVSL